MSFKVGSQEEEMEEDKRKVERGLGGERVRVR